MDTESSQQITNQLIDKDQWPEILLRFIDVLRINIFIVDERGRTILPPQKGRYGWGLLASSPIGFDLLSEGHSVFIDKFKKHGFYLEYNYKFDLHSFAIPINIDKNKTIAYIIIGPVILNKRLDKTEYDKIAEKLGIDIKNLISSINEIRVLSFVGIKAILDLLDEVSRYIIQLKVQQHALHKKRFKKKILPEGFRETAESIYSSIYVDEFLINFLDASLKLTSAECGSVMIVDDESGDMVIRVSRGIDQEIAQNTRVKFGEGVSGLAARDKTSFILHGTSTENNRIKPFLKRPEVKHSLITPLIAKDNVFGILNIHTKNEENALQESSLDTVQTLSQLASIAISSIQEK